MTRTDLHRPAEIAPADYDYLFSYYYGRFSWNTALLAAVRTGEPQSEPTWGVDPATGNDCIIGSRQVTSPWGKLPFFEKEGFGGCDICGANYLAGAAFLHRPSGEVITIGHICADKMDVHYDKGDWLENQRRIAKLRKTSKFIQERLAKKQRTKTQAAEFLAENEGLEDALKTDHYISQDLAANLAKWGGLSEKQVALAFKLQTDANKPVDPNEPVDVKPPEGRVVITGEVLSIKERFDDYGSTMKMTIKCKSELGQFRLWGTCPAAIVSSAPNRGDMVRFTATIKPKENGFGFFSRPTKAAVLAPTV